MGIGCTLLEGRTAMSRIFVVCALLMSSLASPTSIASSAQHHSTAKTDEMVTLFGGSGTDLLERCSAPKPKVGDTIPAPELARTTRDHGLCLGYIMGVSDMALDYLAFAPNAKRTYCVPSEVHPDQLVMVVKKYLEDNPAQLHLPAGVLTTYALTAAFPCR
jgi:Rap1a immunity proteins